MKNSRAHRIECFGAVTIIAAYGIGITRIFPAAHGTRETSSLAVNCEIETTALHRAMGRSYQRYLNMPAGIRTVGADSRNRVRSSLFCAFEQRSHIVNVTGDMVDVSLAEAASTVSQRRRRIPRLNRQMTVRWVIPPAKTA